MIVAFVGALIATLVTIVIEVGSASIAMIVLEGVSALLMLLSVAFAAAGLFPRLGSKDEVHVNSLIYFEDIAQEHSSGVEYSKRLAASLDEDGALLVHVGAQVYVNSVIASKKYKWVNRALVSAVLSGVFLVLIGLGVTYCRVAGVGSMH
ncbi:Pycsar system effector family protein [Buchananella felis]|uniref:Pycsar system effector family protein n=1 Tax=Buchananella felis TaxID=3231492 RepID=UPI003527BF4D